MELTCSISDLPVHLRTMCEQVIAGKAVLFDVRERGEHTRGMLACAQPLPLSMLQGGIGDPHPYVHEAALEVIQTLRKFDGKVAYLHCAAGVRVHPAAACMQKLGFKRVVPLQEGFGSLPTAWVNWSRGVGALIHAANPILLLIHLTGSGHACHGMQDG